MYAWLSSVDGAVVVRVTERVCCRCGALLCVQVIEELSKFDVVDFETASQMTYLRATIQEALRSVGVLFRDVRCVKCVWATWVCW